MTTTNSHAATKPLKVINPGFDRDGLTTPSTPLHEVSIFSATEHDFSPEETWARLQWWESPLNVQEGIKALCARPFLHVRRENEEHGYVPTQFLYPDALSSTQTERIEQAAKSIAAHVRQGRELYTAAKSRDVTDLSRPLLYYYGAVALAKAAIAAVFGVEDSHSESRHGLVATPGPTIRHPAGDTWPTLLIWQRTGIFSRLYQAARWDEVWQKWGKLGTPQSPTFHVLECIRYLEYEWGILPQTGFSRPGFLVAGRRAMEQCILAYEAGQVPYMQRSTPLKALVFQLPYVIAQFMLLYYFSVLARYHAPIWQELMGGATDKEGAVFRFAHEQAAQDFPREISRMLPYPDEQLLMVPSQWETSPTLLADWYRAPWEFVGPPAMYMPMYQRREWQPGSGSSTVPQPSQRP